MRGALLLFSMILLSAVYGQTVALYQQPAYLMLTTYSKAGADVFSVAANTAAAPLLKKFTAGIFSERRFMQAGLSYHGVAAALPTTSGTFTLAASYRGGPAMYHTNIAFGYGRSLGSRLQAGARFHYNALSVPGYGGAAAITFDAGLQVQVSESVRAGLHLFNPVKQRFGKSGTESLPAVFTTGVGYDASPQIHLSAQVQKVEDQPVNVLAGVHYNIDQKLMVRGGVSTATASFFFGTGFRLNGIQVHATASFHPYLGTSPGLLLLYGPRQ